MSTTCNDNVKRTHLRLAGIWFATVFALTFCAGCGSGRSPVSGEVTFDGKPVQEGTITLEPADGQGQTTGGKIADGKYYLAGDAAPLPGKKTVRIFAVRKTGRRIPAGPPSPPDTMVEEIERYIPSAYNIQSILTCEITDQGAKQLDFPLKSQ